MNYSDMLFNKNKELIQEIERLNTELELYKLNHKHLNTLLEQKDNIIKEAIEYINEMTLTSDGYASYGDDLIPEHIVDILKGSDKE